MKFATLSIFAVFILTANTGFAMSLIKTKEVDAILFSEMSGVITYNGKPAEGVVLNLSVRWNEDESIKKTFKTGKNGYFQIPQIERKITTHPLVQLSISQIIIAHYNGESYKLWIRGKLDAKEHSETDGKPENFRCELTDPLIRVEVNNGQLGTPCKWEKSK
ncbi:DUF6795 domain-containing protein [Microbulbifer halophilus]|uniref:DUF6795 domain-containing protein n=1 Tax=Microbulbifer halophilus TaxID=453963 RepID=A0ABW5EFI9_9GAMM|nr:DUF6795 domain-containing protein [Microbulbifer halophilus]MCW8127631.1 hypothetical protein [Microbulbifer halophilus]